MAISLRRDGVIINLAPTGMVPTRALSPHVPLTVDEIVADAKRCITAGASMLHLHARDDAGEPTYCRDTYARIIAPLREAHPDVVICVSLSGRNFPAFEQRADPLFLDDDLKPDMASLTLASMNFSRTASVNSPDMIIRLADTMMARGIRPELEVFDSGMMNYAAYLLAKGHIQAPLYINILLGGVATAQATPAHLGLLLQGLPSGALWAGAGLGAAQLSMNTMALLYGDGVRVGLEDELWMDPERKQLATNVAQVERIAAIAAQLGRPVATAAETRARLGLPPRH